MENKIRAPIRTSAKTPVPLLAMLNCARHTAPPRRSDLFSPLGEPLWGAQHCMRGDGGYAPETPDALILFSIYCTAGVVLSPCICESVYNILARTAQAPLILGDSLVLSTRAYPLRTAEKGELETMTSTSSCLEPRQRIHKSKEGSLS